MQYVVDESLTNFKFWSGAADNAKLLEYSELQELDEVLPEYFNTGDGNLPTATEINDMFWFDFATVCEAIGLQYDEEKGEIIRDSDESCKKRSEANGNDKVGKQNFTYVELEDAWNKLKDNVETDPTNKEFPPSNGYDIRNGYDTTDGYDPSNTAWNCDYDLDSIIKELEAVPAVITAGDLEVYWCDSDGAESDEHGIYIKDGKIDTIY
ncbi:MAG: hypothetical protein IKT27_03815 [Clostridia bacterium]|nr:hypothetical protein [Clostridia bacterium]